MNQSIDRSSTLSGKSVLILGGSSGIGLATAKAAAAEGATVFIVSGNPQRLKEALGQLPSSAKGHVVDLRKEANIQQFFAAAGQFDHLVYSAGENIQLYAISETDIEQGRQFFNVRFWGAFATVKYGATHINEGGSIHLTSGIASIRPGSGWSIASSICGAMEALTRALAVELAPIRVNSVMPGVIKTNLWNSMSTEAREGLYKQVQDSYLVKRAGEAEDVALAHIYLMKQRFVTGQNLILDGGAVLI